MYQDIGHHGQLWPIRKGAIIMFGKATLNIPKVGDIGPTKVEGLSDELAMSFGRLHARTLSDEHQMITVTLESGSVRVIGYCTVTDTVHIGRLHPNYKPPYRT